MEGASVGLYRQRADGRVEHRFEGIVVLLTLLIVPAMFIEETRSSAPLQDLASIILWSTWGVLVLDLVLVVLLAPRRQAALRAHWLEAAVVVAAAPVSTLFVSGLRFARLLRLLRVVQLAAVGIRVVATERRIGAGARLRSIGLMTGFLVVTASLAVTAVDSQDFPNVWRALWWAMVTATTVGYGDYTPHNVAGRLIAVVLMLLGIGFLSMLTASIAARFIAEDAEHVDHAATHEQRLLEALQRIEDRLEAVERAVGTPAAKEQPGAADP